MYGNRSVQWEPILYEVYSKVYVKAWGALQLDRHLTYIFCVNFTGPADMPVCIPAPYGV